MARQVAAAVGNEISPEKARQSSAENLNLSLITTMNETLTVFVFGYRFRSAGIRFGATAEVAAPS
jgi:hypothetical protein